MYATFVDAYLAVVSKRDVREYADRPLPEALAKRILDAGRLAGSARNRQPWRFLIVESRGVVERLAETVYEPSNLLGAKLVVAIVSRASLDAGRCAQNMMLAAWNEGVVSCPNGVADPERARDVLGLGEDDQIAIVLSFGYASRPRTPESRPPEEWIRRANRKPLDELVRRL